MIVLDTHTLIWFLMDEEKLSGSAKKAIHESDDVFVSIASLWEIAIKQSIGKLDMESTIQEIAESCSKEYISLLNITPEHMEGVKHLSHIHGDPFDRLIISQAKCMEAMLITKDENMQKYGIDVLW